MSKMSAVLSQSRTLSPHAFSKLRNCPAGRQKSTTQASLAQVCYAFLVMFGGPVSYPGAIDVTEELKTS